MKRTLKIGKKGALAVILMIAMAIVAGAVLLTYYAKVDGTHAVESLWEINENSTGTPSGWNDAEEHDISFSTTDMAPGDSLYWDFDIKLNADADANDILYFHVTDDTDNGVDCIICTNPADPSGTEITSQEVAPGATETLYFYLELDEYTPADTYTITVSMEAS